MWWFWNGRLICCPSGWPPYHPLLTLQKQTRLWRSSLSSFPAPSFIAAARRWCREAISHIQFTYGCHGLLQAERWCHLCVGPALATRRMGRLLAVRGGENLSPDGSTITVQVVWWMWGGTFVCICVCRSCETRACAYTVFVFCDSNHGVTYGVPRSKYYHRYFHIHKLLIWHQFL